MPDIRQSVRPDRPRRARHRRVRGLGFAIARGSLQAGARVVFNGRNADALDGAAACSPVKASRPTSRCSTSPTPTRCATASPRSSATHGALDIVVNNAGIQRRNAARRFPKQDWDAIIATNLTAPFLVSQAVLPGMTPRKRGKIIHIASLTSELARPNIVPYTAAKGGVRQLTRGMAVELAPHNIQVNAIAPGYFATEMNRALLDNAEFIAWVNMRTPAGRWGEPAEIAGHRRVPRVGRRELHHRPDDL